MKPKIGISFFSLIVLILIVFSAGCDISEEDEEIVTATDTGSTTMPAAEAGSAALTVAGKVSVVDAKSSSSAGAVAVGNRSLIVHTESIGRDFLLAINVSEFPATADYNQDETLVFVHEESVQVFDTVNEILCSIAQTQYGDMKGKGNYRAQIDLSQCSSNKDSVESNVQDSQNQSSSSTKTEYEEWIVNSSRETDQPHIIKFWIDQEAEEDGGMPATLIVAKMSIYQSADSINPYGYFRMDFVGYPVIDGTLVTTATMFKGYMQTVTEASTSNILLQFSNTMNMGENKIFSEQATFKRAADGTSGSGVLAAPDFSTMQSEDDTPGTMSYKIAYDENYFLRSDGTNQKCFDRGSFQQTVWSYGMYDSNGARVSLNSGFPITVTASGEDYHGWVGYHGLWLPDDVELSSGDTVYKETYDDDGGQSEEYEVFIAGGRLMKHTRKLTTLGDLKNVPLQWGTMDTDTDEYVQYRVEWDGSNMKKTATMNEQDYNWEPITSETIVFGSDDYSFHFWSEALGGSGSFKLKDENGNVKAPSDTTAVVFHTQNVVYPTDTVPSSLVCANQCPDPNKLTEADVNLTDKNWEIDQAPAADLFYQYTFATSDMVLKYGGSAIVMSDENEANSWGIHTGLLFEATPANLDILKCEWDDTKTCTWQAWDNMESFYTWETGPEDWNKFTAIKDAGTGQFAKFDPPIKASYQHAQTDSGAYDYKYDGATFNLDYAGHGNLHGIPGRCIDNNGEATECDRNTRWIPEFSIPAGSELTDVNNTSVSYVIKPLDMEQRMVVSVDANCASLSLPSFSLPSTEDWEDPAIGDKPDVSGAPAVIGGVLQ
ncbi:MAG: hypothetical protein GY866_17195 [Proteobacteria bacterium]|nr:hypothetical protein [Pseudomonadota bacterium]